MRFILALVFVGCAFAAPRDAPMVPMLDGRIVGGSNANIANFPYQLSLRSSGSHICGASIISANWAITAAHCVVGKTASSLTIRSGSSLHASGGTIHSISSIIYHSSYNSATVDYDIAVIKVSTAFNIGASGVNTVALPSDGSTPSAGTNAIVSGWGTLSSGSSSLPTQLQSVTVPIVSQSSCKSSYGTSSITDRMLCAGFTAGGKDACQGDSGGPLVVGNTLVGVVSWGRGCALAGYPGVYASVGNLRSWVRQQTGV
ncbi:trypsin delta-like [Onthophagus taurus]|uniref:trypsin delta-like n=1 Tax=Onthophagus taurus TaxID=166361 RepID=UPI000C2065F9|nr:trypsin delta/gamma-like protein CG30031 [Onthophagus taurus]